MSDVANMFKDMQSRAGDISPRTLTRCEKLFEDIRSQRVSLTADESGDISVTLNRKRGGSLKDKQAHVDVTASNLIATPKTENDKSVLVEAMVQLYNGYKAIKYPAGINFDGTKVCTKYGKYREGIEFTKTKEVLGKGNVAGEIVVVKDNMTGKEHALKTVIIASFREEEMKMWISLNEEDFVPSLLMVRFENNEYKFHMEKLENVVTLRDVIDEHMNAFEPGKTRPVSLSLLHGLITNIKKIHDKGYVHRDLHPGNIVVQNNEDQLEMKIIDFGMGQEKSHANGQPGVRHDIIMAFRTFCALYLGQEFTGIDDVINNGVTQLGELTNVYGLEEEAKKEILQLLDVFLDVTNYNSQNFGNSEKVLQHVESIMDKGGIDKRKVLKDAAKQLFANKMQSSVRQEDGDEGGDDVVDMLGSPFISIDFIEEILNGINLQIS